MSSKLLSTVVPNAVTNFAFKNWKSATFISRTSHLNRARFNWDALRTSAKERLKFLFVKNPKLKSIALPGSVTLIQVIDSLPSHLEELQCIIEGENDVQLVNEKLPHLRALEILSTKYWRPLPGAVTFAELLSPVKEHPSLRSLSISAQGLIPETVLSCLDEVLRISPKKVGANLCVASHTLLHLCLSSKIFDVEQARKLIEHGSDPQFAFTKSGMRPIHFCQTLDAAKFVVEELKTPIFFRRDQDALTLAIIHSSVEISRYLIFCSEADRVLASGASLVSHQHFLGELFSSLAISQAKPEVIDLLLEPGVQKRLGVSIRGIDPISGRSALHYTCARAIGGITDLLLNINFDVNIRDANGLLPLEIAMDSTIYYTSEVLMTLIERTDLSSFDIFRKLPAKAGVPRTNATNCLIIPLECRLALFARCLRQCSPERIKENIHILGEYTSILSALCHAPGAGDIILDLLNRCQFSIEQLSSGVPSPIRAAAVANPHVLMALINAGAPVSLQDFPHLLHAEEHLYPVLDTINVESWKIHNGPIDYSVSSLCQFISECKSTQVIIRFLRKLNDQMDDLVLSKLLRSTFRHKSALELLLERPLDEFLPTAVLHLRVLAKKARVLLDIKSAVERISQSSPESPLLPILELSSNSLGLK